MRTTSLLVLVACLQCHVTGSRAVPVRTTGQILLGEVDIVAAEEENAAEITTEESFPKKCVVDGNSYSHSQTMFLSLRCHAEYQYR
ncbi:uncharacterized protein LOC143306012 [Osmia lignaria lignaria]|uniref:uncharacterized protein LOC143306012 n=1 Tax=Osmia lignaria lignaria TaxID=1437193 RepID=UPI00402B3A9A